MKANVRSTMTFKTHSPVVHANRVSETHTKDKTQSIHHDHTNVIEVTQRRKRSSGEEGEGGGNRARLCERK